MIYLILPWYMKLIYKHIKGSFYRFGCWLGQTTSIRGNYNKNHILSKAKLLSILEHITWWFNTILIYMPIRYIILDHSIVLPRGFQRECIGLRAAISTNINFKILYIEVIDCSHCQSGTTRHEAMIRPSPERRKHKDNIIQNSKGYHGKFFHPQNLCPSEPRDCNSGSRCECSKGLADRSSFADIPVF